MTSGSDLPPEDDLFYFETDHLALKGNKDYCEVLKTLVILTAQREKAIKDFNKVVELKKEALENPFEILTKLNDQDNLGVPPMFELAKLPKIDFNKYNVPVGEEIHLIYSDSKSVDIEETKFKPNQASGKQGWSPEEQKRLEELLRIYPPEPVEMRRFQKIAKALGNRTTQQVTSRVQKYFLKLYKAGLPIPGRIPKSVEKHKKSHLHKHQRHNHYLWKPTTFFPDLFIPVQMSDLDDISGPSSSIEGPDGPSSQPGPSTSNYLLQSEYCQNSDFMKVLSTDSNKKSESEMKLDLLKMLKLEKSRETEDNYAPFQHIGFKCDFCDEDPIIGSRWHCTSCMDSIDFCTDCMLSQMYSDNSHPLNHNFVILRDDCSIPIPTNFEQSDVDFIKFSKNLSHSKNEDEKLEENSEDNCDDDETNYSSSE